MSGQSACLGWIVDKNGVCQVRVYVLGGPIVGRGQVRRRRHGGDRNQVWRARGWRIEEEGSESIDDHNKECLTFMSLNVEHIIYFNMVFNVFTSRAWSPMFC